MAPYTLLLLLVLLTGISCAHFGGGLMTYHPRGQDQYGFILVDLHFRQNYLGSCTLSNDWKCSSGDCGNIISSDIKALSSGNEACQSEGILAVNVSTNNVFEMR
ncbi:hypothetical protein SKAU_G00242870 [Synaphobranchus kaupii]|uniref:Uncharacterized protein n=1 Tax=Synaphobranchus kaupii TaxID=118154 RepID=A0A9Q1IUI7_SYNKA|nr:hypothetical protein SKAU_G00242870 [Synaphobranchus kaupii]